MPREVWKPSSEQRRALAAVRRAARRASAGEEALSDAVAAARDAEAPLRAIAEAAGVSHPKVMRILGDRATRPPAGPDDGKPAPRRARGGPRDPEPPGEGEKHHG